LRWTLSELNFEHFPVRSRFFKKTQKIHFFQRLATSDRHNTALITDRWKFATKWPSTRGAVSIFTIEINSKSFSWPAHPVQETSPVPTFSATSDAGWRNLRLSKWAWPYNDISHSQAFSDDRLLSHVTLNRVECRKQTASASSRILCCGHFTLYSHLAWVYK